MADGEKLEQLRRMRLLFDCVNSSMFCGARMRIVMLDDPKLAEAMENFASELVKYPDLFPGGKMNEIAYEEWKKTFEKEESLVCPPSEDVSWEG